VTASWGSLELHLSAEVAALERATLTAVVAFAPMAEALVRHAERFIQSFLPSPAPEGLALTDAAGSLQRDLDVSSLEPAEGPGAPPVLTARAAAKSLPPVPFSDPSAPVPR
jgi:hypothetical protein